MPLHLYKMKITQTSLFILLLLASCGGKEDPKAKKLSDYKVEKINELVGIARIEPANKIYPLGSELAGKITRILVVEGQVVKKGQLLLEMDESAENAQVTQSNSKVSTRNEKIKSLQAKIEALNIKLKAAEVNMKRDRALADSKAGTDKNAIDSENIYQNLQADIIIAKAEVNEAIASLSELSADSNYFTQLKNKRKIYAPEDGMMLSIEVRPGQALAPGAKIGDFAPSGGLIAITEVDELYAMDVRNGMSVSIAKQGTRELLSTGKIVYCSPYLSKKSIFSDKADNLEDRRVREVRVIVDKPGSVLIGSRVECIIKL